MKIGIVTLSYTLNNYGQVLQCFALQKILKNMGHEPYVIQYIRTKYEYKRSLIKRIARVVLYPIVLLRRLRRWIIEKETQRREVRRGFVEFRNREFAFTPCVYRSLKQLQSTPPPPYNLDENEQRCYIVGSDQVWGNLLSNDFNGTENEVYFLNFGDKNTRRIAFAPSFGMEEYPEEMNEKLRENLSRLDYVSCRERDGVKICENVGIKAEHISDPTLVAPISIYEKILEKNDHEKPYCFIYSVNIESAEIVRFPELKEFTEKNSLDIVVTTASGYIPAMEIFDDVTYDYATIGRFLANIKNAEFVVTASFHAIVFSVLFHKPFVYAPLKSLSRGNNRILDFLDSVGLSEHVLTDDKNYEDLLKIPYDWTAVDEKIAVLRNKAMSYLEKALA